MIRRRARVPDPALKPEPQTTATVTIDPTNEMIVLAASIVDWEAGRQLARRLSPQTFLVPAHAIYWEALQQMHAQRLGWDPETLRQLLPPESDLDYLLGLVDARPDSPPNLGYHVDLLEWDRARAEVAKGPLGGLLAAIASPQTPREKVVSLARQVAAALDLGGSAIRLAYPPEDLTAALRRDMAERRAGRAVYPFGIEGLDGWDHDDPAPDPAYRVADPRLIPGAAPGKVTIVTASSGGGKSTVTARIALAQVKAGRRVAYGSWEMGAPMTLETLAAMDLGLDRAAVMTGGLNDEQVAELEARETTLAAAVRFMRNPLGEIRYRRDGTHNQEALDKIGAFIADSSADVFVADLWDRAFMFAHEHEERETLNRQQALVEELGCHAILLQQQRLKDVEQRADKRPTREGIKGSSAWVDVADTILGVHLPSLWKRVPDDTIEILVLKQRYGRWPLAVECAWSGAKGALWAGRTIPYDQPGQPAVVAEGSLDAAVFEAKGKGKRGKR